MAHKVAGLNFHGFQLNTPWPDVDSLVRYKSRFQGAVITIPLQREALDIVDWDPKGIARKLKGYEDVADYALIDPSAGYGQELDVRFTRSCFDAIFALMPNVGLVAAGGLFADNVEEKLEDLLKEFPLGTDAEGKLRTSDDHLGVAEAIRYVQTTDALLRKYEAKRNPQLLK
ncbi:hypothetical protein HYW59_03560 [Candidatus Kaiserbacteria bacterium]|nr:hypothetical protein [Candidatus Kaiserbacteria bacterium]